MSDNPAARQPCTPFIHLRLHTEFSIKDGLVTIGPLIGQLDQLAMPAVAITDLANLFALIKFYTAAEKAGIKAVCGCDVQVENEQGQLTQLVLLARNHQGYLHLTRLISELYTEAEGDSDPVVPVHKLEQFSDGLIALSGALGSDIAAALLAGDTDEAAQRLDRWLQIFPDNFYLEVQRVGKEGEESYISAVVELAANRDCPVVATNDVRFLTCEEFEAHEVRVCINNSHILNDPNRPRDYTDQQFLRSSQEMHELFADLPEAIENSVEIARRCTLALKLDQPSLPQYPVPDNRTLEDYLSSLSTQGLETLLQQPEAGHRQRQHKEYLARLEMELSVINQMGFAGYFLIVMEFIQWAKRNSIPVGPGRGSGAGSIVAWALGITDIDPLHYDLLFERFLNPERISMPDFDVDFCMDGRDRVIQHVAELYGKESVAQIITFGTMAAKAVVRDVTRVQGKSYSLGDKIAKLIPGTPGMTLNKAFEIEPRLAEFVQGDEDAQEIMDMAYKLEGITRNVGKHAGGVVIAPTRLTEFTPLYCEPSGDSLVTQFDKDDVETAGLVKFDFLGLRTLTIIDRTVELINAKLPAGEKPVDMNSLPLDDQAVYRLLQKAETTAVFQLESHGIKELMAKLEPGRFDDIIALVALYRPGPLQSGMVDDFIERKHGRAEVEYPHPDLEPVLANTHGVILYQEQVMKIAQVLGNYTLGSADILRKAMGKKDPVEMAGQRESFLKGAQARQIDPQLANSIFDQMEHFAGYGFNKSHSVAYALVAYQTAWLKAHYPAFFMAAALSVEMQQADKLLILIDECRRMGLDILAPDVNVGELQFTVNGNGDIVYGLGAIKGIGSVQVDVLVAARSSTPFNSLLDLCQRVEPLAVNKRCLESLIAAGAMDNLIAADRNLTRATLSETLEQTMQAAEQSGRNRAAGVEDLFGEITPAGYGEVDAKCPHGDIRPWTDQQRLLAEKNSLGLYLSGHLVDEYLPELRQITRKRLEDLRPQKQIQLAGGLLVDFRIHKGKNGPFAFLTLDDGQTRSEFGMFEELEQNRHLLKKDSVVIVKCRIEKNFRDGGFRSRVLKLVSMEQARMQLANRLRLSLQATTVSADVAKRLYSILDPHRLEAAVSATATAAECASGDYPVLPPPTNGNADSPPGSGSAVNPATLQQPGCRVEVTYRRSDCEGCIMLGRQWCVSPSEELIQQLRREFGRDRVQLNYPQSIVLN